MHQVAVGVSDSRVIVVDLVPLSLIPGAVIWDKPRDQVALVECRKRVRVLIAQLQAEDGERQKLRFNVMWSQEAKEVLSQLPSRA
jgi:hypothetical protein